MTQQIAKAENQLSVEFKLNGRTFDIPKWSPRKNYRMMPKVGKVFVTPLTMCVKGYLGVKGESDPFEGLPTAMMYLFEVFEDQEIDKFLELILEGVTCNNMSVDFDKTFAKDPSEAMVVVARVLKEQYECFFSQAGFRDLLADIIPLENLKDLYQNQE